MIRAALAAALVLAPVALAADGDYPPPSHPGAATERPATPPGTHRVCSRPACRPTIRAAVRAARAGDRIVVAPGRYHETVRIRGAAKRFLRLAANGVVVDRLVIDDAAGVAVRGLTARRGVLVRDARDVALSRISAAGRGIRLLRAEGGTITRSSATGSAAALSIEATPEQTRPMRTMLRRLRLADSPVGLRLAGARWVTGTDLAFTGNAADVSADGATADVCLPGCG